MSHPSRLRRAAVRLSALAALGAALSGVVALAPVSVALAESQTQVTGLKVGTSGESVRRVQQALTDKGYAVAGGVDGVFGSGTQTALKQFQSSVGLNADGTVTEPTAVALGLIDNGYFGLSEGSTTDWVKPLQENLVARGLLPAAGADGVYGAATTAAVKQFQRSVGYLASGSVNAATAVALLRTPFPATPPAPSESPSPAAGGATSATGLVGLAIGARSDSVKQLQQLLIKAGVTVVGGADGIFGALTKAALTSFQQAKGLDANGTVDQATLDALTAATATPQGLATTGSGGTLVGLAFGATGDAVKQLQNGLLKAGFTVRGGADGVFGNATLSALKAFQKVNGLNQTGTVDQATADVVLKVLGVGGNTATAASSTLVGLKAGAVGADVQDLQKRLLALGVEVRGGADGIFGPATANAVKAFQTSQGLSATGQVDQATADKLANPSAPATMPGTAATGAVGFPEYGEKSERVLALQAALVKAGVTLRGGVDGDFGSGTTAAVLNFQQANGLRATGKVDQATADLLGLTASAAPVAAPAGSVTIAAFPTARPCGFADTWHFDRGGGRQHLGVDVIAPAGTEIYAVVAGTITKTYTDAPGSLSGNGVRLSTADGTYFFYAHMSQLADGIGLGVKVSAGQLLGYVGNTGNTGGVHHLHLEVHPKGGSAINPYPILKANNAC